MECLVCKGEMKPGFINHNVELKDKIIILKNVPTLICSQCGEVLFTPETVDKIIAVAKGKFDTKETVIVPVVEFGQVKVA